jgi:uncharacterized protein YjbJ (UPF0337 family)
MKIGGGLVLLLIGILALVLVVRRQASTPHVPGRNEVAGKLKQGIGAVQEAAGRATGNDQLVAEGRARQVEGQAQAAVGKVQQAVGDALTDIEQQFGGTDSAPVQG